MPRIPVLPVSILLHVFDGGVFHSLAIVCSQSDGRFSSILRVRFFAQQADPVIQVLRQPIYLPAGCLKPLRHSPPLVVLALGVRFQVVLALKPFRALDTVVSSQTR